MLWSRRVSNGSEERVVEVDAQKVALIGGKPEVIATGGPGWAFVRGAQALLGWVREGYAPIDAPAEHRFHPLLSVQWNPAETTQPAAEEKIGEALLALPENDPSTEALLIDAGPLVLLEWPVGFRFGQIFEDRVGLPVADRALAIVAAALTHEKARLPSELARLCAFQKNREALPSLLTLVERGATFDGWMDVIDLAAEVGDRADAATLKRLARGRVAGDVRQALLAVAKELERG